MQIDSICPSGEGYCKGSMSAKNTDMFHIFMGPVTASPWELISRQETDKIVDNSQRQDLRLPKCNKPILRHRNSHTSNLPMSSLFHSFCISLAELCGSAPSRDAREKLHAKQPPQRAKVIAFACGHRHRPRAPSSRCPKPSLPVLRLLPYLLPPALLPRLRPHRPACRNHVCGRPLSAAHSFLPRCLNGQTSARRRQMPQSSAMLRRKSVLPPRGSRYSSSAGRRRRARGC
jgi:hypothetical protein